MYCYLLTKVHNQHVSLFLRNIVLMIDPSVDTGPLTACVFTHFLLFKIIFHYYYYLYCFMCITIAIVCWALSTPKLWRPTLLCRRILDVNLFLIFQCSLIHTLKYWGWLHLTRRQYNAATGLSEVNILKQRPLVDKCCSYTHDGATQSRSSPSFLMCVCSFVVLCTD